MPRLPNWPKCFLMVLLALCASSVKLHNKLSQNLASETRNIYYPVGVLPVTQSYQNNLSNYQLGLQSCQGLSGRRSSSKFTHQVLGDYWQEMALNSLCGLLSKATHHMAAVSIRESERQTIGDKQ